MDNQQQERLNGAGVPQENENPRKSSISRLKEKFLSGIKTTLLISLAINFAMFVIGWYGVHKCPVNKNIPLFLLATGGVGLFSKFISYVRDRLIEHFQVKYLESALYTVETIFLVLGAYWVFKVYKPSFDSNDGKLYCNKTVYMFSLVYIIIFVTIAIVTLAGFLCFLICIYFVKKTQRSNSDRDPESLPQPQGNGDSNQPATV